MKEFSIGVGCWLALIFIPIYFVWLLGCIASGHWLPAGIFSWSDGARAFVVIWFIIATIGCVGAACDAA